MGKNIKQETMGFEKITKEEYEKFKNAPSQTYKDFQYKVMQIAAKQEEPHVVKNAFLHSGKEAKIIKEMYGDAFESISPNRDKYLTFLRRVEADGRISELDSILKGYEKK